MLRESAQTMVRSVMPAPGVAQTREALIAAGDNFLSQGVTSVAGAGIYTPTAMRAYVELRNEGLPVLDAMLSSSVKIKESHQRALPMIHLDRQHKLTNEYVQLLSLIHISEPTRPY